MLMDDDDGSVCKATVMLDVEDDETRQRRLKSLLENLSSPLSSQPTRTTRIMEFNFGKRKTFQVQPPSELLSRVQAFLPRLEASNALLSQRVKEDPSSVDIEHISAGMERYIEMNLGLGLFEDRSKKKDARHEDLEMSNPSSSSSSDASDSSDMIADADDYDDSDEESDAEIITSFIPVRRIKPLPRRATNPRPSIIVVSEGDGV